MTEADRIEARELQLLRVEGQQETFAAFVRRTSPRYWPPPAHLRPLFRLCEATRHRPVFARVSMPPRHGKTETLAHLLSWWPSINPAVLNFYVTYGDTLSNATMRRVTKLAGRSGITFDRDVKNLQEWHVQGYDGGLMASTVGGQITGRGCNGGVVVADDMIKGRRKAESKLERDTVWDYFKDDMHSRLEYGASMLVVATRWHEDDIMGRLDKDPLGIKWEDLILPAVHDGNFQAVDERVWPGAETLWPEAGYDLEWASRARARGEYGWWSLYQQQPRPKGKRLFGEPSRFELKRFQWTGKRGCIGCDVAGTIKTYSDWSAYVVMAVAGWGDKTEAWILYAQKFQYTTDVVAQKFLDAQRRWRLLLAVEVNGVGRGVADQVRKPREGVPASRERPDMLRRVNAGIRMVEVTRSRDKFTSAQPLSAAWNAGRVHVPLDADWEVDEFIQQYKDFTGVQDPEDDLVDAGVNAFNCLWSPVPVGSQYRTEYGEDF